MPVKYSDEVKTRAVELVLHAQADPDASHGAITRVAKQLDLNKETLRNWVRNHKNSGAKTPAVSVDLEAENRRLRAELAESKRANEILRRASIFFRGGARPPIRIVVEFIDDNKEEFGVEPIVRVLKDTPAQIATSSYYAYKNRPPSDRDLRDERLMVVIDQIFTDNYSVYGARKMWHALNRDHAGEFGHVARCTVERLMKQMGIRGLNRRRKRPATKSAAAEECPDDQVNRDFNAEAPNCLWVADITYISTAAGWVYAAFILDVFSREIVGWQVTNHLRESLATDALNMALSARYRAGEDVTGLVHHSDRGVQYRAIRYGETLGDSEVVASVGSKGDSFDNAMAEALNSNYKGELIDRRSWSGLIEVMAKTSEWVGWYNHSRLHSSIGHRPPREVHNEVVTAPFLRATAA